MELLLFCVFRKAYKMDANLFKHTRSHAKRVDQSVPLMCGSVGVGGGWIGGGWSSRLSFETRHVHPCSEIIRRRNDSNPGTEGLMKLTDRITSVRCRYSAAVYSTFAIYIFCLISTEMY